MVPFSNGRCEGANLSSHVTELPNLEFSNQFRRLVISCFKLGISIPSLRSCLPGDRQQSYRKDRWRLHCYFCGHPSRAGNRYYKFIMLNLCFIHYMMNMLNFMIQILVLMFNKMFLNLNLLHQPEW